MEMEDFHELLLLLVVNSDKITRSSRFSAINTSGRKAGSKNNDVVLVCDCLKLVETVLAFAYLFNTPK